MYEVLFFRTPMLHTYWPVNLPPELDQLQEHSSLGKKSRRHIVFPDITRNCIPVSYIFIPTTHHIFRYLISSYQQPITYRLQDQLISLDIKNDMKLIIG